MCIKIYWILLDLELEAVAGYLMWMLGTNPRSPAIVFLTAISQALDSYSYL